MNICDYTYLINSKYNDNKCLNTSEYTILIIYISLTSISLVSLLINSISLHLIKIRNNLALSGSTPHS